MTTNLSEQVSALYNRQLENWPMFRENVMKLSQSPMEHFKAGPGEWYTGKIQLSYRKASLTADLAMIERGERPCFLCKSSRPPQQESLEWKDYEILVNPYPAAPMHLTIAGRRHLPQRIIGRIADMVSLADRLPGHCIFYNGPKCGASAPDHFHFQAVPIKLSENFNLPFTSAPYGYFVTDIYPFEKDIEGNFCWLLKKIPVPHGQSEPMVNIIAFKRENGNIRLVVIPRRRHRPDCYGDTDGKMLVSPASVEMMGLFILSRSDDYERVDREYVNHILTEVAYSREEVDEFFKNN